MSIWQPTTSGLTAPIPDDEHRNVHDARGALQDLADVRALFGHRLATPWWYKTVSALTVSVLFIGAGMPYDSINFGSFSTGASMVVLAVILGPVMLRELLKRSTGASLDRYSNGWTVPSMALIALLVGCVCLQTFGDVDLAPLAGAAVGFVFTYLYERRIDRRLARGQFPTAARRAPA